MKDNGYKFCMKMCICACTIMRDHARDLVEVWMRFRGGVTIRYNILCTVCILQWSFWQDACREIVTMPPNNDKATFKNHPPFLSGKPSYM